MSAIRKLIENDRQACPHGSSLADAAEAELEELKQSRDFWQASHANVRVQQAAELARIFALRDQADAELRAALEEYRVNACAGRRWEAVFNALERWAAARSEK